MEVSLELISSCLCKSHEEYFGVALKLILDSGVTLKPRVTFAFEKNSKTLKPGVGRNSV